MEDGSRYHFSHVWKKYCWMSSSVLGKQRSLHSPRLSERAGLWEGFGKKVTKLGRKMEERPKKKKRLHYVQYSIVGLVHLE